MLDAGYSLTDVTAALCSRWDVGVTVVPMSDDRCETHVVVDDPEDQVSSGPRRKAIHFQEWWIKHHAALDPLAFVQVGVDDAAPGPGVLEAITEADVVLLAPSNPVVSIGTILGIAGIRDAVTATRAPVVGLSPIVGGAPIRGMADACLRAIDVPVSAEGVGRHYGARKDGGILDGWLIDDGDPAVVPAVDVRSVPLLMTDDDASAAMARAALELAEELSR
jgi:LPPG:FO 2-phospho-L-lactate transferase